MRPSQSWEIKKKHKTLLLEPGQNEGRSGKRDEVRCSRKRTGQQAWHVNLAVSQDTMTLGKSFYVSGISLSPDLKQWLLSSTPGSRRMTAECLGRGMGAAWRPAGPTALNETRYLPGPCGAPRSTIAAADASGPPEHKGRRERGRRGRIVETLGNIAEKLTERRNGTACAPANTPPPPRLSLPFLSLSRPSPFAFRWATGAGNCVPGSPAAPPSRRFLSRGGVGAGVQLWGTGWGGRAGGVEGGINCANTAGRASKMWRRTHPTVRCFGEQFHIVKMIRGHPPRRLKTYIILGHPAR